MQIIIHSIPNSSSSELEYSNIVSLLIQHLSKIFGDIASIRSSSQPLRSRTLPKQLFDKDREQWISDNVLNWILESNNPDSHTKILAICDFDAYSDNLNFVFGQAHMGGRVAAIYLPRLRQEFYVITKSAGNNLFQQRIMKEAVHELGHAFGLRHCENSKCVMHFSNSLQHTDFKHDKFCERCNKIVKGIR